MFNERSSRHWSIQQRDKHFDKLRKIKYETSTKNHKENSPELKVSTVFRHQSPILFTVQPAFKMGHLQFEEQFLVFETLSVILLGFPFFDKNEIIIDAHNRLFQTPDFTFQLSFMQVKGNSKQKRLNSRKMSMLKTKTSSTLSPGEQKSLELTPSEESDAQEQSGLVEPSVKFVKLGLGLTTTPFCNYYNRSSTSQRFSSSYNQNYHTRTSSLLDTTCAKT